MVLCASSLTVDLSQPHCSKCLGVEEDQERYVKSGLPENSTWRVPPSSRKKVLGEPRFHSNPTGVRLTLFSSSYDLGNSTSITDTKNLGGVDEAIFGLLRFEERCISEKCLAMEDAFEITNFLNGLLHDVFRGSCLPECYDVELSWYGACFYEAWNVA